jgi:succinate dehydrogenase hydrophobic anchor subunit
MDIMSAKKNQIKNQKKGTKADTGSDSRFIIVLVSALILAFLIIAAMMLTSPG